MSESVQHEEQCSSCCTTGNVFAMQCSSLLAEGLRAQEWEKLFSPVSTIMKQGKG